MKKSYQRLEDNSTNIMKQVKYRNSVLKLRLFGSVFLLAFSLSLFAQDGDPTKGKSLFNTNCAACHNLDKKMTGPALRGVEARLANDEGLDRNWLNSWIRNSSALIRSGDAYANKIYAEYNGAAMTAFPQFSDQDLSDILAYTAQEKAQPAVVASASGVSSTQNVADSGLTNNIILGALAAMFMLLAIGLILVKQTLRRFAVANNVEIAEASQGKSLWKAFIQNQFLMLVVAIFFLLSSAYFVYGYLMQVGVDQGYQPVQPIHFSHKIHSGDNKIDCNTVIHLLG